MTIFNTKNLQRQLFSVTVYFGCILVLWKNLIKDVDEKLSDNSLHLMDILRIEAPFSFNGGLMSTPFTSWQENSVVLHYERDILGKSSLET